MALKKWNHILFRPLREAKANRNSAIQFHDFWFFRSPNDLWFYKFIQSRNILEKANLKEIHFYSVFRQVGFPFHKKYIRHQKDVYTIFYTGENVANYPAFKNHLLNRVDLSMGFEYIDHPNYLRFPLWVMYLIEPEWNIEQIKDKLDGIGSGSSNEINKRFCCMVSSHDRNRIRYKIMKTVEKYGPVDSGGSIYNNTDLLQEKFMNDKLAFLKEYYFNICPENSDLKGYVTEKIFQSLLCGCMPIYWGSNSLPEPDILSPEGYLIYNPDHPGHLEKELTLFLSNPKRYYIDWLNKPKIKENATEILSGWLDHLEHFIIHAHKELIQL